MGRACVLPHAGGRGRAPTTCSCRGADSPAGEPAPGRAQARARHAGPPRSPWPPRHAVGRPASRGGTRAWRRAAPAFTSLGEPLSPKKRLTKLKKSNAPNTRRTKFCFSRPDWDCTADSTLEDFPPRARSQAPAASGSPLTSLPPLSPRESGLVPALPLCPGTQPPRPPGRICVASG